MPTPHELRIIYIRSARDKLATLDKLWRQAVAGHFAAEAVAPLRQFLHRLAGSGGSYGFPRLGDAARELEILLTETEQLPRRKAQASQLHDRLKSELTALENHDY